MTENWEILSEVDVKPHVHNAFITSIKPWGLQLDFIKALCLYLIKQNLPKVLCTLLKIYFMYLFVCAYFYL